MSIAYVSELIILHKKIELDIHVYIRKVLYRVLPVFTSSIIMAVLIDRYINNATVVGAVLATIIIIICIILSVWCMGIEKKEKKKILKKVFKVK